MHQEVVVAVLPDCFLAAKAGQAFRAPIPVCDLAFCVDEVHAVGQVVAEILVEAGAWNLIVRTRWGEGIAVTSLFQGIGHGRSWTRTPAGLQSSAKALGISVIT